MPDASSNVRRYYDRNTRRFLRFGHGGEQKAIRRAVWGPGVSSRGEAIEYVNTLVAAELAQAKAKFVLDLGCGVGGSIRYLASVHRATYFGATISETQAQLGARFLAESGITDATIVTADFTSGTFAAEHLEKPVDAAFAVESFLHIDNLPANLNSVARLIRPGGLLIVIDDFISRLAESRELTNPERRWLRDFRAGWYANGLVGVSEFVNAAKEVGFEVLESRDLTRYLELDRSRDLVARVFMALSRWSPVRPAWFENLLGGNALQMCLKNGIVRYLHTVFRRV